LTLSTTPLSLVNSLITLSIERVKPVASAFVFTPLAVRDSKSFNTFSTLLKLLDKLFFKLSGNFKLLKAFCISPTFALTSLASNNALMFKVKV